MSLDPSKLVAVSYPKAIELCKQLNSGTISADVLCRGAWNSSVAATLAALMHAGVGGTTVVEQLRQCGCPLDGHRSDRHPGELCIPDRNGGSRKRHDLAAGVERFF
jgi:hypothetical protein